MKTLFLILALFVFTSCGAGSGGSNDGGNGIGTNLEIPNEYGGNPDSFKPYVYNDRAFPDDNIWNRDISNAPVDPNSNLYITNLDGASKNLHPDFGTVWNGEKIGMPINIVRAGQNKVKVDFLYGNSSDVGPYPIPRNAIIQEGNGGFGDRHVIVVDVDNGMLYELYRAFPQSNGDWYADSGAIFNLKNNSMRPKNWTSADAAGLPIFPGLVRKLEVDQGEIKHALRMTANKTRRAYVFPARHQASPYKDEGLVPMGARLRLKKDFDISKFSARNQVILRALKKYGAFIADNGISFQFSGEYNRDWNDRELSELKSVPGSAFEVIKLPPIEYTPW